MARMSRETNEEIAGWHHIHGLAAGKRSDMPLLEEGATEKLIELLEHFSSIYYGKVAAFSIQGSEYDLVLYFPKERERVSRQELRRRALLMYPEDYRRKWIAGWKEEDWDHYRRRLFRFSEFMRNLHAAYARWYNWVFDRRGRFWAGRFKSAVLENRRVALDCMLYIEAAPLRLGLAGAPEDWPGNSISRRIAGRDGWLEALSKFLKTPTEEEALEEYRRRLAWRSGISPEAIPEEIREEEIKRGYEEPGMNLQTQRFWTDGVAIGSERFIQKKVDALKIEGAYRKRKKAISQLGGIHYTVRPERRPNRREPEDG